MNIVAKTLLYLLLLAISSCRAAYLQFQPPTVNADLKKSVTLTCLSDEAVDIYFGGNKIVPNARYTVSRRAGIDLVVTIASVEEGDIGAYTCRSSASPASSPQTVTLQLKPYFVDNNKVFNKKLGTKSVVDFTILSKPRPGVKYQKKKSDGTFVTIAELTFFGIMVVGKNDYGIDTTNGHLTINSVKSTDAGEYKVTTTFSGATSDGKFTLNVGDVPKITSPPLSSYDLVSGTPAQIHCEFKSTGITIKWEITTKDKQKTTIAGTSGVYSLSQGNLTISSVPSNLEGANLTCIGENAFGSAQASTTIRMVYVRPVITALSSVSIAAGSAKDLKCMASGNPKPKVTWMKVKSDGTTMKIFQDEASGESTFKIASASGSDAGTYKCVAVLSAKPNLKDEATMKLNVLTKPVVSAMSTKSAVFPVGKGESKVLTCVATGNPPPTITMKKGNADLAANVSSDGNKITAELKYSANKSADAGVIKCIANNSVGEASHDITIVVLDKLAPPQNLKAGNVEKTSLVLEWAKVNGATQYSVKQGQTVIAAPVGTTQTVKGLKGGMKYKFSVATENAAGVGAYSAVIEVTTEKYDKPSPPSNVKKPTLDKNVITWDKPSKGSDDPTFMYEVKICTVSDGKCKTMKTNGTSLPIKLKANTEYSFTVTAKNSRGSVATQTLQFKTRADAPPTKGPDPTDKKGPDVKAKTGLSGGAIAGIIIAVILILFIVIDLFCCFFNDCGFSHCCYQTCCADKSKGGYAPTESKDVEKAELKEVGNDHEEETKTVPDEKEDAAAKEKKTEDV